MIGQAARGRPASASPQPGAFASTAGRCPSYYRRLRPGKLAEFLDRRAFRDLRSRGEAAPNTGGRLCAAAPRFAGVLSPAGAPRASHARDPLSSFHTFGRCDCASAARSSRSLWRLWHSDLGKHPDLRHANVLAAALRAAVRGGRRCSRLGRLDSFAPRSRAAIDSLRVVFSARWVAESPFPRWGLPSDSAVDCRAAHTAAAKRSSHIGAKHRSPALHRVSRSCPCPPSRDSVPSLPRSTHRRSC
jgi:hypothetical protein